ncbi:MAG: hypothetical protein WCR17_00250 [Candidatus Methanomethylophilaceae archaeon]|jgi:predicted nucleic acid-binding Zn ribbon protein
MTENKSESYSECVVDSIALWKDDSEKAKEERVSANREYKRSTAVKLSFIVICGLIAIVVMGVSLTAGQYDIGFLSRLRLFISISLAIFRM